MNLNKLHLMETVAKLVPNVTFILDHMANHHEIGSNQKALDAWKKDVLRLSKYKNVNIKLSGLTGAQPGVEAAKQWTFELEKDKIDFVVQHFGENRIVYGSDWPVSALALDQKER
eukprot:304997_1